MVDPTDKEKRCFAATLPRLGEYLGQIGWDKCFNDLQESEVLALVEVIVTAYQAAMRDDMNDDLPF